MNADYFFGLPVSARWGWFSAMVRVYHQSSHLGDEFLLDHTVQRVNLSYEAVDLFPSVDLWDWGRVYLGGGYLFDTDPGDLKHEEQHWATDYSVRAGFQLENAKEPPAPAARRALQGLQWMPLPPVSAFTMSPITAFASPNTITVLSAV